MSVELVHKGYDGPTVTIPKLGLGVYQVPPRDALKAVAYALKIGYRHIDSAALYRNEQAVGQSISQLLFSYVDIAVRDSRGNLLSISSVLYVHE